MTRYRGINIGANPSGAAAFQEDAQRDVGGSFEERVRRIVQEATGLTSVSQAKRVGSNPWTNLWDSARRRAKQGLKLIHAAGLPVDEELELDYGRGSDPIDIAPLRQWIQLLKSGVLPNDKGVLEQVEWLAMDPAEAFHYMKVNNLKEWEESSKNPTPVSASRKRETTEWFSRGWVAPTTQRFKQARHEAEETVRRQDAGGDTAGGSSGSGQRGKASGKYRQPSPRHRSPSKGRGRGKGGNAANQAPSSGKGRSSQWTGASGWTAAAWSANQWRGANGADPTGGEPSGWTCSKACEVMITFLAIFALAAVITAGILMLGRAVRAHR